jgi:hypothetical protein
MKVLRRILRRVSLVPASVRYERRTAVTLFCITVLSVSLLSCVSAENNPRNAAIQMGRRSSPRGERFETSHTVMETSSPVPEDTAGRQYFYYAADGSERNLAADYRSGNGMIWQERPGSRGGKMSMFVFFVGTQEQSKDRPLRGFLPPSCP